MNNYYLDTSVLLVYTLASGKELERYPFVTKLFGLIEREKIKAIISFYALHELYVFALENTPDFDTGSQYGKEAMNLILATKVQVAPLLSRMERMINARLFGKLSNSTDLPHAISAKIWGCDGIVAYDEHFRSISDVIEYKRPEEIVALFEN
jgi:hypothetical protein